MEYRFKQRILNSRITNVWEKLKELFNILNPQGHINQNDSEIPYYACQCLAVDFCICFNQLVDGSSMMTIRVVRNLIHGAD